MSTPSRRLWNEGEEGMSDQLHVGDYKAVQESNDSWTEWLPVERGAAKQRLDMKHGFLQSIIRNQKDRDAYEQAWREAVDNSSPHIRNYGRPEMQRGGEDWSNPKPWRSFLDAPQSDGGKENTMADVGDGSHRDGERVEELDWKAAQRRQAEIMAEEEAAAQKRRSGRGSFTFTDGHPKDRGGNAGRNKGRGSVGGRSDLTRSRIEEEQANPTHRVRKEVKVREGFGAYAVPRRSPTTLEADSQAEAEIGDASFDSPGQCTTQVKAAATSCSKQKSPPAARGGRAGGPATQKGTYLAPDHADFTAQISHVESPPLETPPSHKNGKKQHTEDRHAVESAAKAPRQRKEVRVRPGFGAYRAPSHPPADGATSSLEVMQESGTRSALEAKRYHEGAESPGRFSSPGFTIESGEPAPQPALQTALPPPPATKGKSKKLAAAPPGEENGRTSEIPDGDDAPLPKASDMAIESGHRMADSRMADSQEGDTQEGDKGEGDVNREDGPSKDVEEAEGGLRTEEEEMEEGGNDELAREDAEKQRDEVAVVEKLVEVEAELPEEEEEEEEAEGEDEEEELVDDSNNADVKPEEPGDEDEDGGDGNPPAAGEGGSHAEVPDDRQGGAAEPEGGKGHPEADKGGKAEGGETHAGGQHQAAFLNVESAPLQPRREDKGQQAEARGEAPAAPVRSVGVSDALSHLKVTPAGNVRARAAWAEEMARKSCQPDEGRRPPAVGWKDLELAAANKPKLVPRDPNVPHPMDKLPLRPRKSMSSDSVPSRLDSGTDSIVVRDGGDVKRSASCARFSDDSGGGRVQALLQARRISVSYGLPEGRVTLLASRQVGILESLRHLEETLAAAGVPPSP